LDGPGGILLVPRRGHLALQRPQPRAQRWRDLALRLADAERFQRRQQEEALAEVGRRQRSHHDVLVRGDAHEAVGLEAAQGLHHREAADAGRRRHGRGHDALPGGEASVDDGAADVSVGRFLERLVPRQGGEEVATDRPCRPLLS